MKYFIDRKLYNIVSIKVFRLLTPSFLIIRIYGVILGDHHKNSPSKSIRLDVSRTKRGTAEPLILFFLYSLSEFIFDK